jgi:hypothetical protein
LLKQIYPEELFFVSQPECSLFRINTIAVVKWERQEAKLFHSLIDESRSDLVSLEK